MLFNKISIYISLVFFGFSVQANQVCSSYLTDQFSNETYVFVMQADNYNSNIPFSELHWSMLEASSLDVGVQKYIPQIIEFVFKDNDLSLDDNLKALYTFVGAPKIKISIKFKPDGNVFSGSLKYLGLVYNRRTEMNDYYLKKFGTIESAFFEGAIRPEDILPWNIEFYFVGSHDMESDLYP